MKYSMAQAVALSGTNAHTLRKWESRYNFLKANRTDTNIRFYTDDQIKKIMNVSILVKHGYRVSKIDKMSNDEIHDIIAQLLLNTDNDFEIKTLVIAMIKMDEDKFDSILNDNIERNGLLNAVTGLVYPFLMHIGVLWGTSKIMPAQEHFVSSIIRKKIFSKIDNLPAPKKDAKKLVLFLPEEEHHEIGLLLAYYIARSMGCRVFYLGQNVPTSNIAQVITITKPDLLLTMMITVAEEKVENILDIILEEFNITILLAGNIQQYNNKRLDEVKVLIKPQDLIKYLEGN